MLALGRVNPRTPGHRLTWTRSCQPVQGGLGKLESSSLQVTALPPAQPCHPRFLSPTLGVAAFVVKRSLWAAAL